MAAVSPRVGARDERRAPQTMVGVSEHTHRISRPRFRDDGPDGSAAEPREPFVPDVTQRPLRAGVVKVKARRSVWAAWTLGGVLC